MRWVEQRRYKDEAGIEKETTARKNEGDQDIPEEGNDSFRC